MHLSTVDISEVVTDKAIANRKSHTAFRLTYLDLTLAHSKGQGQVYAHFDCEYFQSGDG